MRIGFAGLGVMGGPMARHLVKAGHAVRGYNRSPEKARAWAEAMGGEAVDSPEAAAKELGLFFGAGEVIDATRAIDAWVYDSSSGKAE